MRRLVELAIQQPQRLQANCCFRYSCYRELEKEKKKALNEDLVE